MKRLILMLLVVYGNQVNAALTNTRYDLAPLEISMTPLSVPEPNPAPTQEIKIVQMPSTLATMPYTDLCNVINTMVPGVYQNQLGARLNFRGGRSGEVLYVIDGMQIQDR
ncbi:MAG: hypothetical protein IAE95_07505 [Chitinophagaceae bacterium]|nr:hypothetical protein [Chitinophagaceae bacterium]